VFYSVKEKNFDERGNRRQADREFSRKAELETEIARQREECVHIVLAPFLISNLVLVLQDSKTGGRSRYCREV
jgi:hypothetical protein